MATGAPSATRRPKGKGPALPSGYVPQGGGSGNARPPSPEVTPPTPALENTTPFDAESLKAAVESLRSRLLVQEAVNESLRKSNDFLTSSLEELKQPTHGGSTRQRAAKRSKGRAGIIG